MTTEVEKRIDTRIAILIFYDSESIPRFPKNVVIDKVMLTNEKDKTLQQVVVASYFIGIRQAFASILELLS